MGFLDMIPLPVRIGALVVVILGAAVAGWTARGWKADAEMNQLRADLAKQRETAVEIARRDEQAKQEKVNEAVREQSAELGRINQRLLLDIGELRNRASRAAAVSETSRPACAGGTGADLSREDAEFLVREAARADEQRAGLVGCYQVLDALN